MTEQIHRPSRRIVFQGLGALGTAAALAGCGSDDGGEEVEKPDAGSELARASDVPVGGGLILQEQKIVLTQPTEGEFKAFSAVCTHQSCLVSGVTETIDCSCHKSKFSLEDGSVQDGPAPSALEEIEVTRDGDKILSA